MNVEMTKEETYREVLVQVKAVLDGESNLTAQMATVCSFLKDRFSDSFFWVGFYCVDPHKTGELVIGPYQGTLGCLRIPFGRGVCGAAAASGDTQLVDNVHDIADHIACDSRSNSEIVVPVWDKTGLLIAVLDIDSEDFAAFDEVDKNYLEQLMADVFA